jgi:acyl-coenzyme A thioesterase PaaI-like protein
MTSNTEKSPYIQDYMEGNICFGCGKDNPEGLQLKSYWEEDKCVCIFHSQEKYQGWKNLMNGGILATVIDCHTMGAATSYAYRQENRSYDSEPTYRYATGTLTIKYLKPTPNTIPIKIIAQITEVKGRKTTMHCEAWAGDTLTAEAEVVAIRVFDSSQAHGHNPFHE